MVDARITLLDSGIRVAELNIPRKDVADFFRTVPPADRESLFIQTLEVGVFCLERARTSQDTEFVRRQVESLLNRVETAVARIPEDTQKALIEKIGHGDGQVLAPIQSLIGEVAATTSSKIREVKDLLSQEIDPAKDTTTLGRALRNLRDLLDPKRTDSIQGVVADAVANVTREGGVLAKAVKAVVGEAVQPLANEVDKLSREIRGQEAAATALEQTTEKGVSYEEEIVRHLQEWCQVVGAEVHHVGTDNRPGDVEIRIAPSSLASTLAKVVVEVRDRQAPMGRKAISDTLSVAMAEREANAGIYLSRSQDGLGKEIGEWAEGECEPGPFVACTHGHLITALRFLIVRLQLANLRSSATAVDARSIEGQLQRIRTAIDRVKSINRKVTDVHGCANDIQAEAEAIRDEIRDALKTIEDTLRAANVGSASIP